MRRGLVAWLAVVAVLAVPGPGRSNVQAFRLRGFNPMHEAALERALSGAERRLESPECRRIFAEFVDDAGAPLQDRLDTLGFAAPDYLSLLVFTDGSSRRTCHGTDVLAVTAPGSRVVYVCGRLFHESQARSAERAELIVLHEALHTLGLGENPPTSLEITRRVGERCGRR